ncbi:MAG TPA: S28 family serine protease [Myxococcaceae bacterium]|nr:S28 family serine protease [Myxococcaceae bacterium]
MSIPRCRRGLVLLVLAWWAWGCGSGPAGPVSGPDAGATDIRVLLAAIPGLVVVGEQDGGVPGYRRFDLTFEQPVDRSNPAGPHFEQRLTLLYRDAAAPTVLEISGYFLPPPTRTELAALLNGNQLSVEHRYFGPSIPDPPVDWARLDIRQAADDHHAILLALRPVLTGRWLSTGLSKGGMASVFHRRFHPSDVDGTLAYSPPILYDTDQGQGSQNRFIQFLRQVGTDSSCRQALRDLQVSVLERRSEMLDRMNLYAAQRGIAWNLLGTGRALEFAVEETPFLFWQFGAASRCATIPAASATSDALFAFLDATVGLSFYSDVELARFLPYYYQAADQLGYPIDDESYLVDGGGQSLLQFPDSDHPQTYLPSSVPTPVYGDAEMRDIQSWVTTQGSRLLFIYGEIDPWSAAAFELGQAADSFRLVAPGGNHLSGIHDLAAQDRAAALEALGRWAGVTVSVNAWAAEPASAERTRSAPDRFSLRGAGTP